VRNLLSASLPKNKRYIRNNSNGLPLSKIIYDFSPFATLPCEFYVGLGHDDHGFEWLDTAFRERSDMLVYLRVDSRLDSIVPILDLHYSPDGWALPMPELQWDCCRRDRRRKLQVH
jgi:hypothetical protein